MTDPTTMGERRRRPERLSSWTRFWREDEAFVTWMVSVQYAYYDGKKLKHWFGSDGKADGIVLYMWEAWCAGKGKP